MYRFGSTNNPLLGLRVFLLRKDPCNNNDKRQERFCGKLTGFRS